MKPICSAVKTAVQIQRARKAACGRIVGPADVSRVSGKTRNHF
ncbi:hypothetical protein [Succiniclasticum ruminis]|nr:hypothetical protein [Succiniclasticum ruminis]